MPIGGAAEAEGAGVAWRGRIRFFVETNKERIGRRPARGRNCFLLEQLRNNSLPRPKSSPSPLG